MQNRRARLALAVTPLSLLLVAVPTVAADPPVLTTGLVSLSAQPNAVHFTNPLTAYPLNAPPINGFVPQVVFALTDQQDKNDVTFASKAYTLPASGSWTPTGTYIPSPNPSPTYFVATFDTGSQSHIISYSDSLLVDFENANRGGSYPQLITGASGDEEADISDAVGIYMTGFQNASSNGTSLSVTPGTMKGQWNTSVLTAQAGSALPNIIGSPMAAQYQTVISNSNTRHLTVNNQTYTTPTVSFQNLNTSLPSDYVRLTLSVQSASGVSPQATYFPSFDNFNNWGDNPVAPTFWGSLFATTSVSHTAGSAGAQDFLFDTGAQVTVLSQDTAASVGFYTAGPNPSTPDFTVEIAGVGGTTTEVPGFYLNTLSVTTNGGPITWTHVPVIVFDLPDPRDGIGFVPGILGTNLFTDRDLIVNGGTTNPFVGISPIRTARWNAASSSTWGDDNNWILGMPDAPDAPANFTASTPGPQTVTVDADYTVGSLSFNSPNSYTLMGPGELTFESSTATPPSIAVSQGSHKISAALAFASPASLVIAAGAQLDITTNTLSIASAATPAVTVRQYLHDSLLVSSTAAADPQHLLGLGYLSDAGTGIITVETTYIGDSNLDGKVDADDYALIDRGYAKGLSLWSDGDFNYDGLVTAADYLLIDRTFALQGNPLSATLLASRESQFGADYVHALLVSIPEPSSGFIFATLVPFALRRKRRVG